MRCDGWHKRAAQRCARTRSGLPLPPMVLRAGPVSTCGRKKRPRAPLRVGRSSGGSAARRPLAINDLIIARFRRRSASALAAASLACSNKRRDAQRNRRFPGARAVGRSTSEDRARGRERRAGSGSGGAGGRAVKQDLSISGPMFPYRAAFSAWTLNKAYSGRRQRRPLVSFPVSTIAS